jgi:hypothetical protein
MIGLALILAPVGYVMAFTGFAGDGSGGYNLGVAFRNAGNGIFTHRRLAIAQQAQTTKQGTVTVQ